MIRFNERKQKSLADRETHTRVTALTQFVDVNGIRFAYRWFGKEAGVPLLFHAVTMKTEWISGPAAV
jgi:hypothetical protein